MIPPIREVMTADSFPSKHLSSQPANLPTARTKTEAIPLLASTCILKITHKKQLIVFLEAKKIKTNR
jgi:hypothetical protein